MARPEAHWRTIIAGLQTSLEHERTAATEWMRVAEVRLKYLVGFDKNLTAIIEKASQIEQIFNVGAPKPDLPVAPVGAGGEEVARLCRQKLRAMVNFTEALADEALKVDRTLVEVFGIANEALRTQRPTMDLAPTTLADEIGGDLEDYQEIEDSGLGGDSDSETDSAALVVSTSSSPVVKYTNSYSVSGSSGPAAKPSGDAGDQLLAFLGQSTPSAPRS
jgi:hypothetical protein